MPGQTQEQRDLERMEFNVRKTFGDHVVVSRHRLIEKGEHERIYIIQWYDQERPMERGRYGTHRALVGDSHGLVDAQTVFIWGHYDMHREAADTDFEGRL